MKTKLLGLILMTGCFCATSFAQITVNNTNVAPIGDLIKQAQDTMPTVVAGAPGTNLTWNFSALHNNIVDTLIFEVPGWPPYANPFPTANLAAVQNRTNESFMINNSSGLVTLGAVGMVGTSQVTETYTPSSMLAKWPSTYGTNYTEHYVISAKLAYVGSGYDSVRLKNTVHASCNVDAWGSMQTPLGTFPSIRQKRVQ
ncbi:MAG TPA: hypothetical protein VNZ86_09350, partial [Bacteroidia bacterium]|nr:hypothetical protein [Bacteroidia bacterium]